MLHAVHALWNAVLRVNLFFLWRLALHVAAWLARPPSHHAPRCATHRDQLQVCAQAGGRACSRSWRWHAMCTCHSAVWCFQRTYSSCSIITVFVVRAMTPHGMPPLMCLSNHLTIHQPQGHTGPAARRTDRCAAMLCHTLMWACISLRVQLPSLLPGRFRQEA